MPRTIVMLLAAVTVCAPTVAAQSATITIRMSMDEDPFVPPLAESLGCLKTAGIRIVPVRIEDFAANDYEFQAPLTAGKYDVAYHWFNHAVFGARHGFPLVSVMTINDGPGMKVMVARQQVGRIRSAADFAGKRVAEGAGYATKSLLTDYLARQAGLPRRSYTSVLTANAGREAAVRAGLVAGEVDVVTAQEPMMSMLEQSGLVSTLYDLNSGAQTAKVLGAPWPAHSLLVAPGYLRAKPDAVQRLVNGFTCAMRFINRSTAEEIVDRLPAEYRPDMDRAEKIAWVDSLLPTFARGDYTISRKSVKLVAQTISSFDFDVSASGKWRSTEIVAPRLDQLYDNRFARRAMRRIPVR